MSIPARIPIPADVCVTDAVLRASSVVGIQENPFNRKREVQTYPGARWELELTFLPGTRAEVAELEAWLVKLNGRAGTFLAGDPFRSLPRGSGIPAQLSVAGTLSPGLTSFGNLIHAGTHHSRPYYATSGVTLTGELYSATVTGTGVIVLWNVVTSQWAILEVSSDTITADGWASSENVAHPALVQAWDTAGAATGDPVLIPVEPTVSIAAAAGAATIELAGLAAAETGILLPGDLIQVGAPQALLAEDGSPLLTESGAGLFAEESGRLYRLHMVTSQVDADAAGAGSADIWPPLREATAASTVVRIRNARGLFALASNAVEFGRDRFELNQPAPIRAIEVL